MHVELIRYPSEEDWLLVKQCAFATIGRDTNVPPSEEWKHKILRARHSPIRELRFVFRIEGIPSWVATHLARHHVGVQPYIQSQRNDRQSKYDRNAARQDAPVNMIISFNGESIQTFANKRLCGTTAEETRAVARQMCRLVLSYEPAYTGLLVPNCVRQGGICHEMKPCRRKEQNHADTRGENGAAEEAREQERD